MGEGDLAGSRRRAAADEPGRRDRVVRGPERPRGQGAVGGRPPGDAGDLRHLDRLVGATAGGRIEGSRRAASDFPAPGGPMTRAAWPPAAATSSPRRSPGWPLQVGEVGQAGAGRRRGAASGAVGDLAAGEHATGPTSVPQRRHRQIPRRAAASPALAAATAIPRPRLALRPARPSRARPESGRIEPSRASSPASHQSSRARPGELARGEEDRRGDRQVEAGPGLAQVGRRQVRGDPLQRELEARVDDRRPDALA